MTVDLERLAERFDDALGEPLRILAVLGGGLQHDEFVATETGDHVGWADDGSKPARDVFEQLIADRMTKRIIDRFETIEVDQVNGQVPVALAYSCEHQIDSLAELRTVGQPREFVIFGEVRDALLRALALGYVFKDDDGAAAGHRPARYGNSPIAVGRRLNLIERVMLKAAQQFVEDQFYVHALVIAGADAMADQLGNPHADTDRHLLEMEQFQEAVIPDLQAVLLVEHAQAMRHVVESDVKTFRLFLEAGGQRRFLACHGQRLNDDVSDAERNVDHPVEEHQHHEADDPVQPVGIYH